MNLVQLISDVASRALDQAHSIALVALPLLFVTLIGSSGKFFSVLRQTYAASTRVNVLTYLFDLVVMSAPFSLLSWWVVDRLAKPDATGALEGLGLPAWALIGLALWAGDGVSYFRHRLEHSKWLWPSHAMHHSDESMNCLTILRFHPINRVTTIAIDLGALLLMGFPFWAAAASMTVRHYYGIFVHANVPWTLGPLGYVFVSPAMHRWHHVREGQGVGSNFSSVFSMFDRLFGTYYCPGPCNAPLGVEGVHSQSFTAQLIEPFVIPFRRMARSKLQADRDKA